MGSKWKPPYFPLSLITAIKQATQSNPTSSKKAPSALVTTPVQTRARGAVIVPPMVGANLAVHNGKDYIPVPPHWHNLAPKLFLSLFRC